LKNHIPLSFSPLSSSPSDRIFERLRRLSSFSGLAKSELEQIAEAAELVEIERSGVVYAAVDAACDVFIVLSGLIKQIGSDACPVLVGIAGAGQMIGLESLFDSGSHRFTAIALTSCKLARINADRFIEIMFANEVRHVRRTLSITIGAWLQTVERHPFLMAGSVKERLRAALLELAEDFGTHDQRGVILNVPLTHQMLADMIGVARQTVSRMVMDLERKGILFRDGRRFTVVIEALCQTGNDEKTAERITSTPSSGMASRLELLYAGALTQAPRGPSFVAIAHDFRRAPNSPK
jgi:CRP/FNR family transcriptional regulator, cyclic AMP receptor protein